MFSFYVLLDEEIAIPIYEMIKYPWEEWVIEARENSYFKSELLEVLLAFPGVSSFREQLFDNYSPAVALLIIRQHGSTCSPPTKDPGDIIAPAVEQATWRQRASDDAGLLGGGFPW
uniref:Uncharacterized protein n=1 Tax=Thermogemmatispora argillosa TaxID=2045280 RepID=A0A455T6X0_9CHLR|nr:hypothetical protein KTA_19730 [Thermogemmatispora argillosa]